MIKRSSAIITQVREVSKKENILAAVLGFLRGGFVPFSIYHVMHNYVHDTLTPQTWGFFGGLPYLWLYVIGALIYSARNVYQWEIALHGSKPMAYSSVILLEGALTFVPGLLIPRIALGFLIGINGLKSAYNLVIGESTDMAELAASEAKKEKLRIAREQKKLEKTAQLENKPLRTRTRKAKIENQDIVTNLEPVYAEA